MTDLAGLKARIADDLERDDLTTQIAAEIPLAIEFYADRSFHFLEDDATVDTTAAQAYVALPDGLRVSRPHDLEIDIGSTRYDLRKMTWRQYRRSAQVNQSSGQPTDYAYRNGRFYLYPVPNQAYTITTYGIFDEPELTTGTSENAWTNEALKLIAAEVEMRLARDVLRDDKRMRNAQLAVIQELAELTGKSTRRRRTGKLRGYI